MVGKCLDWLKETFSELDGLKGGIRCCFGAAPTAVGGAVGVVLVAVDAATLHCVLLVGLFELVVVQLLVGVGGTHTGCKWLEVPLLLLYLLLLLLWIQPPSTECCRCSWSGRLLWLLLVLLLLLLLLVVFLLLLLLGRGRGVGGRALGCKLSSGVPR